jgi:hypothetical protein
MLSIEKRKRIPATLAYKSYIHMGKYWLATYIDDGFEHPFDTWIKALRQPIRIPSGLTYVSGFHTCEKLDSLLDPREIQILIRGYSVYGLQLSPDFFGWTSEYIFVPSSKESLNKEMKRLRMKV